MRLEARWIFIYSVPSEGRSLRSTLAELVNVTARSCDSRLGTELCVYAGGLTRWLHPVVRVRVSSGTRISARYPCGAGECKRASANVPARTRDEWRSVFETAHVIKQRQTSRVQEGRRGRKTLFDSEGSICQRKARRCFAKLRQWFLVEIRFRFLCV